MFGPLVALFWLLWTCVPGCCAESLGSQRALSITSCSALRHALRHPSGPEVLVLTQSLRCEWRSPVVVEGRKIIQSGSDAELYTLDLVNLRNSGGLVVETDGHLTLDRLVIPDLLPPTIHQDFRLSFAQTSENATLIISRSYVVYPLCHQDLQRDASTLEDGIEGRYRVCGTRLLCGYLTPSEVQYFVDEEMKTACMDSNRPLVQDVAVAGEVNRPIKIHTVLVALLCLLLGFSVLGGIVVWMCRSTENKARVLDTYFHKEEKSVTESEASGLDVSLSRRVIAIDDFSVDLDQQLGVGGFGTVYIGTFQNQVAAVKVIKLCDVPEGQDAHAEADLSLGFSHANVIKTYAVRQVKLKDLFGEQHLQGDDDCTLIFLEYCDKGELSRAIDRGEYVLSFESLQPKMCAILHCALDIAKGLQYLHSLDVVHGDIKPDNILRKPDELDPRGYVCKICDFGLSKKLESMVTKTDTLGMISYMPPEMLRKGRIGRFTDVYSFGMLLWEMVTSDVPYSEVDYNQILSEAVHGRRPSIPDSTPPTIKSLIKACWISDYAKRPSAVEIVRRLHLALSEWYASFPANPIAQPFPRLRSSRRSDRFSMNNSTVYAESLYSDTALDEHKEERIPTNIIKSHSTCIFSESTAPELLSSTTGRPQTPDLEDGQRKGCVFSPATSAVKLDSVESSRSHLSMLGPYPPPIHVDKFVHPRLHRK